MNIGINTQLQQNNYKVGVNKRNSEVSFKGLTSVLDYLATNPVWGATAVDVGSMGTPRVCVDTYNRGASAGFETGFREYSSTINDASLGLYGLGAGTILAGALSKNFGVKDAQRIFASADSIDVHSNKWKAHNGNIDSYINDYVDNLKGFNPLNERADKDGFVSIAQKSKEDIKTDLKELTKDNLSKKERGSIIRRLNSRIIEATGAESEIVLKHGDKSVSSTVQTATDDFYRLTKALKENNNIAKVDKFVGKLKSFCKGRAVLGIGAAMAVSACFQPFNVWMTKKRTGSDGFAGMEGREKDNSAGFKALKLGSSAAMATIAMASLNAKPAQLLDKMLFKGVAPTIDQFKGIYATTICSRMLSARDKDELRETDTKDILGFLNWLVIGNLAEKGAIAVMEDKSNPIIKYNEESHKNGFIYKHLGKKWDRIIHGDVSTRKEIISEAFRKENGAKSMLNADGTAKKMGELLKDLSKTSAARKNLKIKNIAQIINYGYSALVLGAGIPYLNISLTEHFAKKRKQKQSEKALSVNNQDFVVSKSNFGSLSSMKNIQKSA